ncbi:MAG: M23 family metallopeptidase [Desulfobacterales bacterium]|nr:MAG: M23 family metallopeptidase [Desulfobacterales bacterium]
MPKFKKRSATLAMTLTHLMILWLALTAPAVAVRFPPQDASDAPEIYHVDEPSTAAANAPLTVIEGKIGRQPIYNLLVAFGIAPSEVLDLTRSFKGLFDFRKARPKDEFKVSLTPQKKLQKLTYKTGLTDQYIAVRTDNGDFHTYHQEISLDKEIIAKSFTIESSLFQAVTGQQENSRLAADFADIFSWDIDFYLFPRKGDTIWMLYEKYSLEGDFVKYGKILAAHYIGNNKKFSAYYFDDDREAGYYDENGVPLRKMFMRVPVKLGMRTSSYSARRFHPISKSYKRHTGIDYSAPHGTPIFATASGTVTFAGWREGYGKLVTVRHPNGYTTYYGHCSRLLVKKGAYVKQGQTIAEVGQTGRATGPHVHYEVRVHGQPVNPSSLKTTKAPPLPPDQRSRFEEIVQQRLLMVEDQILSENDQPEDSATGLP